MKKIGKKEIILLVLAILVFLTALGYFCYKEIPELIKPKVYYRTYTKEKGWTKWSKNGEMSGNKYSVKAIQIKLKNGKQKDIYYKTYYRNKWEKNNKNNAEVSGDMRDDLKEIRIGLSNKLLKKYNIHYMLCNTKKCGGNQFNYTPNFPPNDKNNTMKKIRIWIEEKR